MEVKAFQLGYISVYQNEDICGQVNLYKGKMVMYCYKCGKKVSSEDNFCLYCGTNIENNQSIETYEVKNEESISVKKIVRKLSYF